MKKCVFFLAVICLQALPYSVAARSPEIDSGLSSRPQPAAAAPSSFLSALDETTYFGGTTWMADSIRWEAIQDSVWTFDTGVGSIMEGWRGIDLAAPRPSYFRRLSSSDPGWTGGTCVGSSAGLGGNYSYWVGVLGPEADSLCYADGQGYGNMWSVCLGQTFSHDTGDVFLDFDYTQDSEDSFDRTQVSVQKNGTETLLATYTGSLSGHASFVLSTQALPAPSGPLTVTFCFKSDETWSDEDGLVFTTCGAFAVDDIVLSGAVSHTADFEGGSDGWEILPQEPGPGDWSRLAHIDDLPSVSPGATGTCTMTDSVLVFFDPLGELPHPIEQVNVAASPWIDLKRANLVDNSGKFVQVEGYFDLPLLNYVFALAYAQWYPDTCTVGGVTIGYSPFVSHPSTFQLIGNTICASDVDEDGILDLSGVIPPNVEQVRVAIGVRNFCMFFNDCTGVNNTTPWFDNVRFGVHTVKTLQSLIDDAAAGDTLTVPPGEYRGEGNRNLDFGGKNLVLVSSGGPNVTVIDCESQTRGFIFQSGEDSTSVLDGFTIRNGVAPTGEDGGGVFAAPGTGPTIRNCILFNCKANSGGGVAATQATISGCSFQYNTAVNLGGGLAALLTDTVVVANSEFFGNTASNGGAIAGAFLVTGCHVFKNVATGFGGGTYVADSVEDTDLFDNASLWGGGDALSFNLSGCVITENTATHSGGGLYLGGVASACLIQANTAARGGGVYLVSALGPLFPPPEIITSTVTGNRAGQGGGLFPDSGDITGCTVAGNDADQGGGMYVPAQADPQVTRTILWGNCALGATGDQLAFADSTASVEFVCSVVDSSGIYGDGTLLFTGPQAFTDPLFCNAGDCNLAPVTGGTYKLLPESPGQPENSPCGSLIGANAEACQSSGVPGDDILPSNPGLRAYPNPFSRGLTIQFAVPEDARVSIQVFDVRGRIVRAYEREIREGVLIWDGRDGAGRLVRPGAYFIGMRAPGVQKVARVIRLP